MRTVILGLIIGLGFSCALLPAPTETVRTNLACCKMNDGKLQNFQGCSVDKRCNERYMMQGHVECSPVSVGCNGRCCHYWNVEPN